MSPFLGFELQLAGWVSVRHNGSIPEPAGTSEVATRDGPVNAPETASPPLPP